MEKDISVTQNIIQEVFQAISLTIAFEEGYITSDDFDREFNKLSDMIKICWALSMQRILT